MSDFASWELGVWSNVRVMIGAFGRKHGGLYFGEISCCSLYLINRSVLYSSLLLFPGLPYISFRDDFFR
jgi:hypothetical protein